MSKMLMSISMIPVQSSDFTLSMPVLIPGLLRQRPSQTPCRKTSPRATSNRFGMPVRNRSMTLLFSIADDGIEGAGHARIGNEGRPFGQDPLIGGLHVGVGPQDGAYLAVQKPADGLFFRRGLGMDIHDNNFRLVLSAVRSPAGPSGKDNRVSFMKTRPIRFRTPTSATGFPRRLLCSRSP